MGEVIFQAYACFWMCVIIFWLLKPRYHIRKSWWRFAGVYAAWFLMDMVEWQATKAAMVYKTFQVYAVRSVLRFMALYFFLYLIHKLCYGRFAKLFFAAFLGEAIFVMGYIVVQILLLPIQSPGEAFLTFDSDSGYTIWVFVLLTPLLTLLLYLLRNPRKLYRRLDIGRTLAEKAAAAMFLLVIGSGYILNREEMVDYGNRAFFTAIFLIAGNFTCWAVLICYDYRREQQKNRYLKLRQRLLGEHEKVLKRQMEFSKRLQEEINSQLKKMAEEGGTANQEEVKSYYSRLSALSVPKEQKEYLKEPILNGILAGQIEEWEKLGCPVVFENGIGEMGKIEAADWMELFLALFGLVNGLGVCKGKEIRLRLDSVVGHYLVELEFWRIGKEKGGKGHRRKLRKLKEIGRNYQGRVRIKMEEEGRVWIGMDLEG